MPDLFCEAVTLMDFWPAKHVMASQRNFCRRVWYADGIVTRHLYLQLAGWWNL